MSRRMAKALAIPETSAFSACWSSLQRSRSQTSMWYEYADDHHVLLDPGVLQQRLAQRDPAGRVELGVDRGPRSSG